MRKIYLLILILACSPCYAYFIGAGTYVPYFKGAQNNDDGSTTFFEVNPFISIGEQYPLPYNHFFSPEFGYAYFLDNPTNLQRDLFYLGYNLSYTLSDTILIRYGLSTQWYRIKGQGGEEDQKNGDQTVSFKSPDKTVTTYNTTLNIGTELFLPGKTKSVRFDFQIMNFRNLDNWAYNYLLTLNFYR